TGVQIIRVDASHQGYARYLRRSLIPDAQRSYRELDHAVLDVSDQRLVVVEVAVLTRADLVGYVPQQVLPQLFQQLLQVHDQPSGCRVYDRRGALRMPVTCIFSLISGSAWTALFSTSRTLAGTRTLCPGLSRNCRPLTPMNWPFGGISLLSCSVIA